MFPVVYRKNTERRVCFKILYFQHKVNTVCVVTQNVKKKYCKLVCVKHVFPHLYKWCSKILTCGMCFYKNMGTRMCILMKIPQWQGNAIVFPVPITIVLGKAYVLKTFFFWCLLKAKIRNGFSRSHPSRCFDRNSSHFEIKS